MFIFKKWRRRLLAKRPFPDNWLQIIERDVTIYRRLTPDDKKELLGHILVLLNEKTFEGCGGLEITDRIKVTIAAYACILLLHRKTDYYPGLHSILVYPNAFVVQNIEQTAAGVVAETPRVLQGESWRGGSVVLSWDDVRRDPADIHDGHNVVLHEFAHQLDSSGAKGDSTIVLRNRSSFIAWAEAMRKDYEKLRDAAFRKEPAFLDSYGAANPAEFFAVATEFFFEKAGEMKEIHPRLYNELKNFYSQDPAEFA